MPLENPPRDSPQEWLRHARSDLTIAASPRPEGALPVAYCFHAQQAAEKSIKAVYIQSGIEVPLIHNIHQLLNGLDNVPDEVYEARTLTPYAVESRYPVDLPDATVTDLDGAVQLARTVVEWAEQRITDTQ